MQYALLIYETASDRETRAEGGTDQAEVDAAYAAFTSALIDADDSEISALRTEAIDLAEIVVAKLPDEPEARGLLALMLYTQGRRPARLDAEGRFVPLDAQDHTQWDADLINRAEDLLRGTAHRPTFERYQLEAAISSCHVARVRSGAENANALDGLYRLLFATHPSLGGWLAWCAARARAEGPGAALQALQTSELAELETHQPYWALRADLHRKLGQVARARHAYRRALDLTADPAVARWLRDRVESLGCPSGPSSIVSEA